MSSSPRVSVVMTVWNGAKYIAESIESILQQTFEDYEFIIIDDGSTDTTCEIIESFRDPRILLTRRPHLGVVPAANFGASLARGEYIARLDADDISLPDRLALQVAALDKNPKAVMCYTDVTIFGDNTFGDTSPTFNPGRFWSDTAYFNVILCYRCPFTHSSVMFRKDTFEKVGGYVKYPGEDFDLYARFLRIGGVVGIPQKLVRYRRHLESATIRRLDQMKAITEEICLDHIQYFLHVPVSRAQAIYEMLKLSPAERKMGEWLGFCLRVLRHPASWRPEPLGWLAVQTLRLVLRKS